MVYDEQAIKVSENLLHAETSTRELQKLDFFVFPQFKLIFFCVLKKFKCEIQDLAFVPPCTKFLETSIACTA